MNHSTNLATKFQMIQKQRKRILTIATVKLKKNIGIFTINRVKSKARGLLPKINLNSPLNT
jgi:hypothetical protein